MLRSVEELELGRALFVSVIGSLLSVDCLSWEEIFGRLTSTAVEEAF